MDYTEIDMNDIMDYFAAAHDLEKYEYYVDCGERKIILKTEITTKKLYEFCHNY